MDHRHDDDDEGGGRQPFKRILARFPPRFHCCVLSASRMEEK